jgi:F0F1-type ATP synthase assembly protein I
MADGDRVEPETTSSVDDDVKYIRRDLDSIKESLKRAEEGRIMDDIRESLKQAMEMGRAAEEMNNRTLNIYAVVVGIGISFVTVGMDRAFGSQERNWGFFSILIIGLCLLLFGPYFSRYVARNSNSTIHLGSLLRRRRTWLRNVLARWQH